jgi:DHA3 family macrolide efflux protein-like MFS transporter
MGESGAVANQKPLTRFFIIFAGQSFSLFGSQLVQFALVWWLTKTSGSASVLAFASIMAILPQVFLSPFAGALIDRWNRRVVMIVADGSIALATVVLAVLYALGVVQVWHIYAVTLARAVGSAFHWPAMLASTTMMVPENHLSRVAGLNHSLQGLANIAAPPIGALLIEVLPMSNVLAIDVGTAMLAIGPLLFIDVPQPRRDATGEDQPSVLSDLREGLRYMWSWRGGLFLPVAAMVVNLLATPASVLTPLLVTRHFKGDALEFAWLQSAFGAGMVLGGLTLGVWGGFKRRVVTALVGLILSGLSDIVIGLAPPEAFLLALGARFVSAFMIPIINGSAFALMQTIVPARMQGRVFTLVASGSSAMSPLGLAIAGPVADMVGIQIWFIIGGAATSALGIVAFFVPSIMNIESRTKATASNAK